VNEIAAFSGQLHSDKFVIIIIICVYTAECVASYLDSSSKEG